MTKFKYGYVWGNDGKTYKYGYAVSPLIEFLPKGTVNKMEADQVRRAQCKVNGPEDRNMLYSGKNIK